MSSSAKSRSEGCTVGSDAVLTPCMCPSASSPAAHHEAGGSPESSTMYTAMQACLRQWPLCTDRSCLTLQVVQ